MLQVLGLAVIALFLTTASPEAASFDECDDQFAACQDKCGTWEWTWVRSDWVPDWCYNANTQQWYVCGGHQEPVYEYQYGDHIDYFECQPGGGKGICQCTY